MPIFIFQILHYNEALKDTFFVLGDEGWNLLQRIDFSVALTLKFVVSDHLAIDEVGKTLESQPQSDPGRVIRMNHIEEEASLLGLLVANNGPNFNRFSIRCILGSSWIIKSRMKHEAWTLFFLVIDVEEDAVLFYHIWEIVPGVLLAGLERIVFTRSLGKAELVFQEGFGVDGVRVAQS